MYNIYNIFNYSILNNNIPKIVKFLKDLIICFHIIDLDLFFPHWSGAFHIICNKSWLIESFRYIFADNMQIMTDFKLLKRNNMEFLKVLFKMLSPYDFLFLNDCINTNTYSTLYYLTCNISDDQGNFLFGWIGIY